MFSQCLTTPQLPTRINLWGESSYNCNEKGKLVATKSSFLFWHFASPFVLSGWMIAANWPSSQCSLNCIFWWRDFQLCLEPRPTDEDITTAATRSLGSLVIPRSHPVLRKNWDWSNVFTLWCHLSRIFQSDKNLILMASSSLSLSLSLNLNENMSYALTFTRTCATRKSVINIGALLL